MRTQTTDTQIIQLLTERDESALTIIEREYGRLCRKISLDICLGYFRMTGEDLTIEEFEGRNKLELAQLVLNSASCNALDDFGNMLLGGSDLDEEGEGL